MFPSGGDRLRALSVQEVALRYSSELEPACFERAALGLELQRVSCAIKALVACQALLAGRLATMGDKDHGAQVGRDLAVMAGTVPKAAEGAIKAAKVMAEVPELEAAARQGKLSGPALEAVARAAQVDPGCVPGLVRAAEHGSLADVRAKAYQVVSSGPAGDEQRKVAHEHRYLRQWCGPEGWQLRAGGSAEDGAVVMAALDALADKVFAKARKDQRQEAREAYLFDSLVELARSGPGGGTGKGKLNMTLMVRVDHEALVRGFALPAEVCEIDGIGRSTPQAVLEMTERHDPFVIALLTKAQQVSHVVRMGRKPSRAQLSALEWLYGTCAVQGCSYCGPALQTDHRADWADTRYTTLYLLDRLCRHHHGLKTRHGWALVAGQGKRAFVPPDDPRHPGRLPSYGLPEGLVLPEPPKRPKRSQAAKQSTAQDRRVPVVDLSTAERRQGLSAAASRNFAQAGAETAGPGP